MEKHRFMDYRKTTETTRSKKTSVTKKELALLYFPDSTPHVAVKHLNGWIKRCQPLCDALAETHLSRYAKWYSPRQRELIEKFLGEPG